jgi:hypothetical protein
MSKHFAAATFASGTGLIVTLTNEDVEEQPVAFVTTTEYAPAAVAV